MIEEKTSSCWTGKKSKGLEEMSNLRLALSPNEAERHQAYGFHIPGLPEGHAGPKTLKIQVFGPARKPPETYRAIPEWEVGGKGGSL